jgi:hypothetical protein
MVSTFSAFVAGTIGRLKQLSYVEFICFTDKSGCNVLSVGTVLEICKYQNHALQDIIKLLLINIWSWFRSTSKQTVEVMLPPVHATMYM